MSQNYSIAPPSYNLADGNTEAGLLEFSGDKLFEKLEKITVAEIISYNPTTNRAVVQVLNQAVTSDGQKLPRKPLEDIPVVQLSGGGFTVNFPLQQGDKGLLLACDRDISVFKQNLTSFAPATYQKHRYKDSFFLPLLVNGGFGSSSALTISNANGVILSISNDSVVINTPQLTINSSTTTISGDVTTSGTTTSAIVKSDNGATGTFTNSVTVANGIVTGGS